MCENVIMIVFALMVSSVAFLIGFFVGLYARDMMEEKDYDDEL